MVPGRRKRHSPDQTSEAILSATETALADENFKISEIARMANISRSTIYHYFGSKDALIAEIRTRQAGRTG